MMPVRRLLLLSCLVLTACASPTPTPTPVGTEARLPTRLPTAMPTATPFSLSARDYYEQGRVYQRAADMGTARQHFTWAIQRDPTFTPAYVSRGSAYLAEGDLDAALRDADAALAIERTAEAYRLRGEILLMTSRYTQTLQAFDEALARDPSLREETFQSRWEAARAMEDQEQLAALSAEYAAAHPGDGLGAYYEAWVAFVSQRHRVATALLDAAIEATPDAPALLWYVLGRAYAGEEAWQEAVVSLETARALLGAGDASMAVHSDQPAADLFAALGRAYLGAGRCAEAETALAYALALGASNPEHVAALEEARTCQSSTPPAEQ